MGDLNREQLADITAQRMQENIARKNRQVGKQIEDTNTEIATLKKQVLESHIDLDFSFSTAGSSTTKAHNLGSTPTGWYIIDLTGGVDTDQSYKVRRTSWDSSNITLASDAQSGTITGFSIKIRVFL